MDVTVISKKLDADLTRVSTKTIVSSSIISLVTSFAKELTKEERLLSQKLCHWSQLASRDLKWGVQILFLSLIFSMLNSMALCLVMIINIYDFNSEVANTMWTDQVNYPLVRVLTVWWLLGGINDQYLWLHIDHGSAFIVQEQYPI